MLERLSAASRTLDAALDSYMKICRDIRDLYVDGQPINTIPHDLATGLAKQLPVIKSFKKKLRLAERVAGRSTNTSSSLVPIHILPYEVLIRIFELVLGDDCVGSCKGQPQTNPILMNICSYWHHMIICSPFLWTHIDLPVQVGGSMTFRVAYAKIRAERAARMPLKVHIVDTLGRATIGHDKACRSLLPFITSVAPRVRSFTLKSRLTPCCTRPYGPVLTELFRNCSPGVLTTLVMDVDSSFPVYLAINSEPKSHNVVLSVDVSNERLEESYRGITVLRLSQLYPRWTSSAYHGLVELRLRGDTMTWVTESQLVGALKQSPGLRIFECAARLEDILKGGDRVEPVSLNNLEVVNLGLNTASGVEAIVRWLAPGPKPLQLLISWPDFSGPCLVAFLARSNITRVYSQPYQSRCAMHFVHHLPNLHTMALAEMGWNGTDYSQPGYSVQRSSALDTLYLIGCNFKPTGPKDLYELVSLESLRCVVLYGCSFGSSEEFISGLSTINPRVMFQIVSDDESNP
ncbi:hypothetical protein FRC11_013779, partial [Ceratobasidium sp. 423]